jgi:hypothetical protein
MLIGIHTQNSCPNTNITPVRGVEPAPVCLGSAAGPHTSAAPHWPTRPSCNAHWGRLGTELAPDGTAIRTLLGDLHSAVVAATAG